MFTIENIEELLIDAIEFEEVIQAVANIETMVQPQDAWGYQTIIELLEQDSIDLLVVYQIDEVVGYCLYQVIFEQAEILRIGTHPDYQRQGIASQVFAKLNTELMNSKVENLLLEVRADNFSAIALYEQQGLAVINRRKGYYQMPHRPAIDALIMQRVHL
ncbi:ribosomal protein S18-alanine N-acetyltransferase [Psychrobacter sp. N25K4-3-2]|uniref:ribosomal protein S18-alanine N-acetyltransferase n=1 Tax=Psychrobacter sp. N25K4-3-2 TaxID=2785026 RepID=UPI00188CB66C|nr:ribosomal protein S18-alanine N-acetyltransferase [Psychrobacter sp. N25K4-3-2]MBF4490822.1 ribosomal protein S18-alanine N-acetyltransferase [Psychrobacter sp. N25K4-3-2]